MKFKKKSKDKLREKKIDPEGFMNLLNSEGSNESQI